MGLSVKHLRDLFGGKIPTAQVLQGVATGMADCGVTVVIDPNTSFPYAVMDEKKIVLPSSVKSARALLICRGTLTMKRATSSTPLRWLR